MIFFWVNLYTFRDHIRGSSHVTKTIFAWLVPRRFWDMYTSSMWLKDQYDVLFLHLMSVMCHRISSVILLYITLQKLIVQLDNAAYTLVYSTVSMCYFHLIAYTTFLYLYDYFERRFSMWNISFLNRYIETNR